MASLSFPKHVFYLVAMLLLLALNKPPMANAGDPDIISDFISPPNSTVNGTYFTYTGLRELIGTEPSPTFKATKVTMAELPSLNGQSVSFAFLQYPAGSINPPHTHPRSAELLFLVEGLLEVGFVDTANKLYTQNLQAGDMFVFPKGLVHYQYNSDPRNSAVALSAFGSASAGTVSLPVTLFNTSIADGVLAKAFKTDIATIEKIKAGFKA